MGLMTRAVGLAAIATTIVYVHNNGVAALGTAASRVVSEVEPMAQPYIAELRATAMVQLNAARGWLQSLPLRR